MASEKLSVIPKHLRPFVARLGPFQGGAQETLLLAITGLAQVGPKPELATDVTRDTWPELRDTLLENELIAERELPGSARPFLRFEADFASADWQALSDDQRAQIERRYQRHYFQYVGQLKKLRATHLDEARELVDIERGNLIAAAQGAIDEGEEWALEFVERLSPFLSDAQLEEEVERLRDRVQIHYDPVGSPGWLRQRSNDAERLLQAEEFLAAKLVLSELIEALPADDHFGRMSNLARRAYVSRQLEQSDAAMLDYQAAVRAANSADESTARSEMLQRIHLDQASLLAAQGQPADALTAGQRALRESESLKDWITMAQVAGIQVDLSERLGDEQRAGAYRRLRRLAISCSDEGKAYLIEQQGFIDQVCEAVRNPANRPALNELLATGESAGWVDGVTAMRRILAGERDENLLCEPLEWRDGILVHTILQELLRD
ncbi:MAG: hypothetical protein ACPG4N_01555 [Gammaproteobacteria bacterium]